MLSYEKAPEKIRPIGKKEKKKKKHTSYVGRRFQTRELEMKRP